MTPYQTTRVQNDLLIHIQVGQVWIEVLRVPLTEREWGVVHNGPESHLLAVLKTKQIAIPTVQLLTSGPAIEPRLAALMGPVSPTFAELEAAIFE